MTTLTVWGPDTQPPDKDNEGLLAFWQQFLAPASPDTWFSIPSEVDQQREALRGTYIAWLHTLGIQRRRGRKLVDRMAIRPGLSYWWMSIPSDFSLGTDSPAYKAVRMMALTRLANTLGATRIDLVSDDRSLRRLVGGWAEASGRRFTVRAEESPPEALALSDVPLWRRCVERVYRTSGAVAPLGACWFLLVNVVLARRAKSLMNVPPSRNGVALIDYLDHLGSQVDGFSSNYWGPLVPALEATDVDVWWLHISNGISSAIFDRDAKFTAGLNEESAKRGHDLIHAHLTYGVVLRSLRDYLSVVWFGLSYRRKRRSFEDSCSGIPLWPAYMEAFREHFYGATAMLNCLWLNLFERALTGVPRQRMGIYLFENQPWEMALIHAWKKSGHGRLIGVAHSTTVFWDIRYFKDPRDVWSTGQSNPMPWPDAVAVNGQSMRDACLAAGYPSGRLIDVEALRYLQFREPARAAAAAGAIRVLVCGEYSPIETRRLLNMTSRALELAEVKVVANFRPHPAAVDIQPRAYSRFGLDASPSAKEAVDSSDIVICGGISSVAIDALARGKPAVSVRDPHGFSVSQSGHGLGVYRADTAEELCGLILNVRSALTLSGFVPAAELNLDPGLQAWRALVGLD